MSKTTPKKFETEKVVNIKVETEEMDAVPIEECDRYALQIDSENIADATNAVKVEKDAEEGDSADGSIALQNGENAKEGEEDATEDGEDAKEESGEDSEKEVEVEPKKVTFQCPKCYRSTPNLPILKQHFYKMHKDLQLSSIDLDELIRKCEHCGNIFDDVESLKQHACSALKVYPCTQCDRVFFKNYNLTAHMRAHDRATYECDRCTRTFKSHDSKLKHEEKHNNPPVAKPRGKAKRKRRVNRDKSNECLLDISSLLYKCGACSETFKTEIESSKHACSLKKNSSRRAQYGNKKRKTDKAEDP